MEKDCYKFGECFKCGKMKALCNDICAECKNKPKDNLSFLKEIFGI